MKIKMIWPIFFVFSICANAQTSRQTCHDSPASNAAGQRVTVPIIDGAINPEKISDSEAAKVLLLSTMAPAQPTAEEQAGQLVRIAPMGLSDQDYQVLTGLLGQFHAAFTGAMAQAQQAAQSKTLSDSAKASQIGHIIAQGDLLCDSTWSQVLASVSPDGRKRLQDRLLHVKAHMKIIPPPPM